MIITHFTASHFRNFASLTADFSDGVNVFYGDNGAGKTNLLEAIFVFSLGRSQRGASDQVLVSQNEQVYRLEGTFASGERSFELAVAYERGGRKRVTLDDVAIRTRELYEHCAVVAAGPEDNAILSGSPGARRQFLDVYLSQFSMRYLSDLSDYQKCLAQKNAALRNGMDPEPFNEVMVQIGTRIMVAREQFLLSLQESASVYYAGIADGEPMAVVYQPSVKLPDTEHSAVDMQQCFHESLVKHKERERILQVSMVGPHRDDIAFSIADYPARTHASQGQLRTGAIALKLAVYDILKQQRGRAPILLLDEIFAELDDNRADGLMQAFGDFGQLFLTTAVRPPESLREKARNYRIVTGSIEEIH